MTRRIPPTGEHSRRIGVAGGNVLTLGRLVAVAAGSHTGPRRSSGGEPVGLEGVMGEEPVATHVMAVAIGGGRESIGEKERSQTVLRPVAVDQLEHAEFGRIVVLRPRRPAEGARTTTSRRVWWRRPGWPFRHGASRPRPSTEWCIVSSSARHRRGTRSRGRDGRPPTDGPVTFTRVGACYRIVREKVTTLDDRNSPQSAHQWPSRSPCRPRALRARHLAHLLVDVVQRVVGGEGPASAGGDHLLELVVRDVSRSIQAGQRRQSVAIDQDETGLVQVT